MGENVNLLQAIIIALDNAFAALIDKVSGEGAWETIRGCLPTRLNS